jgi:hypothetical protein
VIPEPSYWDPVSPFLYQGPLELWSAGQPLVQIQVSHGLCGSRMNGEGLYWNGQRLLLQAVESEQATEAELRSWHASGVNTLVAPFDTTTAALADMADALGFLLLVRLTAVPDMALSAALAQHACSLGWLVPQELWQEQASRQTLCKLARENRQRIGVEVREPLVPELAAADFLACDRKTLPVLSTLEQPRLLVGNQDPSPLIEQGILGILNRS